MIVGSSLSSGEIDATLTDFPLERTLNFLEEFPEAHPPPDSSYYTSVALETLAS